MLEGTERCPLRSSNCDQFRFPISKHHLHPIHIKRTKLVGPNISWVRCACDRTGVAILALFARNYRTSSNPHLPSASVTWGSTPRGEQFSVLIFESCNQSHFRDLIPRLPGRCWQVMTPALSYIPNFIPIECIVSHNSFIPEGKRFKSGTKSPFFDRSLAIQQSTTSAHSQRHIPSRQK